MRLIYYFNTWAIIWHGNAPVFQKICTDLQEICSISSQNCFCYCFCSKNCSSKFRSRHSTVLLLFLLRNLLKQSLKLFRNNDKNNFASKCCNFFANLCKSSEILEQCHVNWWLDYRIYGSVSYSFSCNLWKYNMQKIKTFLQKGF